MPSIISKSHFPEGEARCVEVDGVAVVVCRVEGVWYALDGTCPHAGAPLFDGVVSRGHLVCPWHGWQFDVKTGACAFAPEMRLDRYVVTDLGDTLEIASA